MKRFLLLFLFVTLLAACTPKITYNLILGDGIDVVDVDGTWEDGGCTLRGNTTLYPMDRQTEVDTTVLGETTVVYTTTINDTTYQCKRVVKVVDRTAPVLSLNPGVDTILVGETWTDAGAEATDNVTEELTITVLGTVDINVAGTYVITYETTDDSGNDASISRVVTVIE